MILYDCPKSRDSINFACRPHLSNLNFFKKIFTFTVVGNTHTT